MNTRSAATLLTNDYASGSFYRVQAVTSLVDEVWTDFSGDISALRTNVIYGVSTNPPPKVYFYRVKEVD